MDEQDKFLRGLSVIMRERGLRDSSLSEAAGLGKSFIRDLRRKQSSPKTKNAEKLALALGTTIDAILRAAEKDGVVTGPTVQIVGIVGAGARVPVFEAYEPGTGPRVACPPGLDAGNVVAVEIEGDSMEPVYSQGDLLFYTRVSHDGVPSEAIGRRCVCETADGLGWVKQVKRGGEPGLFNLISLNPTGDNLHDVPLKWAAPVLLHWPRELARRV